MILYIVQAHRDIQQIIAVVRQIADGENACVINLDPRLASEVQTLHRELMLQGCRRFWVRIGSPPNWGGISQVYTLLDAMQFALTVDSGWEFLINLSADTLVLAPQQEIRTFYKTARSQGQRVHLAYFGRSTGVTEFCLLPWGEQNFELELRPIHLYRRVSASATPQIEELFRSRSASPLFRWKARGSIHVTDLFAERKLHIRQLLPTEAAYRRTAFKGRLLWGGRAWFTLERSAVERILSDPVLAEINQLLEHFFCPDELFLHTYLGLTDRFTADEVNRHNQRFRDGDSLKIHDGMVDELFSSGAFFARKIACRECPVIMRRVEERCSVSSAVRPHKAAPLL